MNGAHDNTPYHWLTPNHMLDLLRRKNNTINTLKLRLLNATRAIAVVACHLDDYKRFVLAVSQDNIPRLQQLVAVQLWKGSGILSVLDKIKAAKNREYQAQGFTNYDYQATFLFHKLCG